MSNAVAFRNYLLHAGYKRLLKPVYFRLDPEDVHDRMTRFGRVLGEYRATRFLVSVLFSYSHPLLEQDILGIHFPNPVGLAAGFDKDALLTNILPSVGFGFAEVGSITGEPCAGNPRPRLWRLPASKALVIYYGLKNRGCEEIAERLRQKRFAIPIGISIAKTNSADTVDVDAGIQDYAKAFRHFLDIGHYFTVNISCPNAFGGEPFTAPDLLDALLSALERISTQKPIFLKISPDLSKTGVDDILSVCERHRVHGFICSNLTKKRDNAKIYDASVPEKGGISGKVQEDLANAQIRHVFERTQGKYLIIGCGGIFNAEDAYAKIRAGASLVQLITGMIFEGPQVISEINRGLVRLLERDGFHSIAEARGSG